MRGRRIVFHTALALYNGATGNSEQPFRRRHHAQLQPEQIEHYSPRSNSIAAGPPRPKVGIAL
jgi:hypothetical protein